MKKKFVFLTIALVFIFVMFVPLIPTVFLHNFITCDISACARYIISLYELILNWEKLQQPPLLQ